MFNNKKGFTLIELLLVMALVLIIGVFSATFYTRFIAQMAVRDAREGLSGMFHEAQALSMSGRENSTWGVKYQEGKLTLFSGGSYANRNQTLDKNLEINSHIIISGFEETVFNFPAGKPNESFPAIIISWGNNEETLKLNSEGVVE
jgi:prepilin-type N-terminal cleavage/methylation domain-containing protein